MPVGLPPPRTPPAPPPGSEIPPQFHTPRGRRTLAFFGAGALVLVLGFLVFTAVEFFYLMRNGTGPTEVGTTIPAGLPSQVPFCTAFKVTRSFTTTVDGGKHFLIQGDCPENRLQLDTDLTRLMQYNGWTVHDDGQGTLSSYAYDRRQRLDISITAGARSSNETSVAMEVWTGLAHAPDGFPAAPAGTPSPR